MKVWGLWGENMDVESIWNLFLKRIEEHLGTGGSSKTYAMHLSKWWECGPITVTYYKVEEDKCLQLFEDILWNYYKPVLGRQGKK